MTMHNSAHYLRFKLASWSTVFSFYPDQITWLILRRWQVKYIVTKFRAVQRMKYQGFSLSRIVCLALTNLCSCFTAIKYHVDTYENIYCVCLFVLRFKSGFQKPNTGHVNTQISYNIAREMRRQLNIFEL